jgi:6-phosphogluconolactonase
VTGQLTRNLASYRIDPQTGALTRLADYAMGDGPNWTECVRLP